MDQPRFQRRKAHRPQEITAAAFAVFAEKGYAGARVEEVARRAGISKGLMYRYFATKEDLFKAVIRSVVVRRVDALLEQVEHTELSAEDLLRGPVFEFMRRVPDSPVAVVIRLLIAEGHRYPDLVEFYWDNVVARAMRTFSTFLQRGVERGEFRETAVTELPQLLLAPVMLSIVWKTVFSHRELDTDRLIATHIDVLVAYLSAQSETA